MKYVRQLLIILFISFLGELLKYIIPLSIPASIYGMVLLFLALELKILKVSDIKETSNFLIEIMPLMFVPAGVGLLDSWGALQSIWIQVVVITLISTVTVFLGVVVSLLTYEFGLWFKKKVKIAIFNPLLISVIAVMVFLVVFHIDYADYQEGAKYISYLLTPATVCLAVPLYEQFELLRKNLKAVIAGIISGVFTSMTCILVLALLFRFDHQQYVTLLPKSITTAIGMGVSEELGGYVTITVAVIIITGIFGYITADAVLKLFHIEEPIAKGIAIGSASHAVGTAKAMELGEIEGVMSSLSIAVSGILTVVAAMVYANLL